MARPIPEDRFKQLIEAATRVFVAEGYRRTQIADVARERSLNEKYLGTLWRTLATRDQKPRSVFLNALRRQWQRAAPADARQLAAAIGQV